MKKTSDELWGDEAAMATRVVEWFHLMCKMRHALDEGVPADDLMCVFEKADPEMLDRSLDWLIVMLTERFRGQQGAIDTSQNATDAVRARWDAQCREVKYRREIKLAKDKMATGADRDEILDAVMALQNRVKSKKQKTSRRNLAKILLENKALPRARQKRG
jgi:hypothetical protein